jgi:cation:H+ antiporter
MTSISLLLIAAGLGLLVAGGEILVRGASGLAAAAGISRLVIGLTIVAFVTSAPEMLVSVYASERIRFSGLLRRVCGLPGDGVLAA